VINHEQLLVRAIERIETATNAKSSPVQSLEDKIKSLIGTPLRGLGYQAEFIQGSNLESEILVRGEIRLEITEDLFRSVSYTPIDYFAELVEHAEDATGLLLTSAVFDTTAVYRASGWNRTREVMMKLCGETGATSTVGEGFCDDFKQQTIGKVCLKLTKEGPSLDS